MYVYTISDGEKLEQKGEGGAREMCMTARKMVNKTKNKHAVMAAIADSCLKGA